MKEYEYTTLAELDELPHSANENLKVNIYAFVADLIIRSRPTDALEDSSVITKLKLRDGSSDTDTIGVIYSDSWESFSDQIQSGQIIRMHRAKIKKMADGKLFVYGKLKTAGFAVLLFSGQLGDEFTPVYQSSAKFTLVSDYKERINSLRMLFVGDEPVALDDPLASDPRISYSHVVAATSVNGKVSYVNEEGINQIIKNANVHRLNEFVLGGYSDITVQAIALFVGDRNNVVLRCWDTTSPPRKIFVLNADFVQEMICRDEELEMAVENYWCDIVLYEEHADFARNNVKCGDILLLTNTHLYHSKSGVTLTMHGGGQRYSRSIIILDGNSELKRDLLRSIDGFNANKDSFRSDMQTRIADRDINNVQQIVRTLSCDEVGGMEDQQTEMAKCWAGERMRQMHTIQLGWIHSYAWKKKQGPDAQLERSFNLAKMAVQFIVRQVLERLFTYNKDLFANLAKLSRRQRNTLFMNFLMTYMEGAYGDAITLRHGDKQSDDKHELVKTSKMRKGENSKDDAAWSLLCNLFPGTVLRSLSWKVDFSYNARTKIFFALICNRCNLWCTTSARSFDVTPLCPLCFKREITDSCLFLQCYFLFNGIPREAEAGSKKYYFLFPIQLLAFFLVDVPKNAQEAAQNYRRGVFDNERKATAVSIQEKMLSRYSFTLDEIVVRKIKEDVAIFEVVKLTFTDR